MSEPTALREAIEQSAANIEVIRSSLEEREASLNNDLAAYKEQLANAATVKDLSDAIEVQNSLNVKNQEFDARITEMEAFQQRIEDGDFNQAEPEDTVRSMAMAAARDAGAKANEKMIIAHDPAYSEAYEDAFSAFISQGKSAVMSNAATHDQIAAAGGFYKRYLSVESGLKNLRSRATDGTVQNALATDYDPGLGIRVPPRVASEIIERVVETSPIYGDSRVVTTTTDKYTYLVKLRALPDVQDRHEREVIQLPSSLDGKVEYYAKGQIDVHEEFITDALSWIMLEDGIDAESEVSTRAAQAFALEASRKVTRGAGGVKESEGVLVDSRITRIPTVDAGVMTMNSVKHLLLDLDPQFDRGNNRLYMSKGAKIGLSLLKDGESRYLWEPSNKDGTPSQILGQFWVLEPYLDGYDATITETAAEFATGALPMLYGDVNTGCRVVQRLGIMSGQDDITSPGIRKLWWRRRWGFGVVEPEALRLLIVS
jgi:HK97 family phage major capsid protein